MEIYRTRNRAIMKVLIQQYGVNEAYDMHGWMLRDPEKCSVCQSEVNSYSEWYQTGYEREKCTNGCWSHEVYSFSHYFETRGFHHHGEWTEKVMRDIESQIKKNAVESKRKRLLFYRKKKSQRGKTMKL